MYYFVNEIRQWGMTLLHLFGVEYFHIFKPCLSRTPAQPSFPSGQIFDKNRRPTPLGTCMSRQYESPTADCVTPERSTMRTEEEEERGRREIVIPDNIKGMT